MKLRQISNRLLKMLSLQVANLKTIQGNFDEDDFRLLARDLYDLRDVTFDGTKFENEVFSKLCQLLTQVFFPIISTSLVSVTKPTNFHEKWQDFLKLILLDSCSCT